MWWKYIKDESAHTVDLEMQIERHYGLREVVVLPKSDYQPEMVRKMLGKAAASHISKKVPHISKIGISWGNPFMLSWKNILTAGKTTFISCL
nr:sugar-binding domain-containing protein [Salimicrobium flavidum]